MDKILDLRVRLYRDEATGDVSINLDKPVISVDHMQMLASFFVSACATNSNEGYERAIEVIIQEALKVKRT